MAEKYTLVESYEQDEDCWGICDSEGLMILVIDLREACPPVSFGKQIVDALNKENKAKT